MRGVWIASIAVLTCAAVALAACGPSSKATTGSAALPGCGSFCQNAGPAGGPSSFQCPGNNFDHCPECPGSGCIAVGQAARVTGNVARLQVRCLLAKTCSGAFLLLQPSRQVGPAEGALPENQWVGGSDFQVPANSTATVPVGLTALGERLVRSQNGYLAAPSAVLRGYFDGRIHGATRNFRIRLTMH